MNIVEYQIFIAIDCNSVCWVSIATPIIPWVSVASSTIPWVSNGSDQCFCSHAVRGDIRLAFQLSIVRRGDIACNWWEQYQYWRHRSFFCTHICRFFLPPLFQRTQTRSVVEYAVPVHWLLLEGITPCGHFDWVLLFTAFCWVLLEGKTLGKRLDSIGIAIDTKYHCYHTFSHPLLPSSSILPKHPNWICWVCRNDRSCQGRLMVEYAVTFDEPVVASHDWSHCCCWNPLAIAWLR